MKKKFNITPEFILELFKKHSLSSANTCALAAIAKETHEGHIVLGVMKAGYSIRFAWGVIAGWDGFKDGDYNKWKGPKIVILNNKNIKVKFVEKTNRGYPSKEWLAGVEVGKKVHQLVREWEAAESAGT